MFNLDDISILKGGGANIKVDVDDRSTSSESVTIKRGEPVKRDNASFVIPVATGDPEIATDILVGIAQSESTETSSAEGTVEVALINPSTVLRGRTSATIADAAALLAVKFDYVTFDVAGSPGAITIDHDEGDDPNSHGLCIIDGDFVADTVDVLVHINATLSGSRVGDTID